MKRNESDTPSDAELRAAEAKLALVTEALRIALGSLSKIALTITSGNRLREYAQDALSRINKLEIK